MSTKIEGLVSLDEREASSVNGGFIIVPPPRPPILHWPPIHLPPIHWPIRWPVPPILPRPRPMPL